MHPLFIFQKQLVKIFSFRWPQAPRSPALYMKTCPPCTQFWIWLGGPFREFASFELGGGQNTLCPTSPAFLVLEWQGCSDYYLKKKRILQIIAQNSSETTLYLKTIGLWQAPGPGFTNVLEHAPLSGLPR